MKSGSHLERVLRSGRFAVTAELTPPRTTDPQAIYDHAQMVVSSCDAVNTIDSSGASANVSSLAMAALLIPQGHDVVMQLTCRDRNRIAIQAEILGAAALGVRNLLCLTGDGVQAGDQPETKPVFDLESMTLLRTARTMRDKGRLLSGREIDAPPKLFLGAASNPFAPPHDVRPLRLAKKVEAGADFIQTQYCFDVERLRSFMSTARDRGLHERVYILVGVGPLRSARTAEWMRANVPGVVIPDEIVARLKSVPRGKQQSEGTRVCIEIIEQVREIEGISGIHLMAYRQEELVPEILSTVGLLPREADGETTPRPLETSQSANR